VIESVTDRVAAAFCGCTLPKAEWTHGAHLRVGLWHFLRYPEGEALRRLRDEIRRYNTACGVANTESSGYHETITRFYVPGHRPVPRGGRPGVPRGELAEELIRLCGDKGLPLRHWTRELLMGAEARLGWVEPDLRPLA
jgi:hypothetical protein